jgi:hypothetical protein
MAKKKAGATTKAAKKASPKKGMKKAIKKAARKAARKTGLKAARKVTKKAARKTTAKKMPGGMAAKRGVARKAPAKTAAKAAAPKKAATKKAAAKKAPAKKSPTRAKSAPIRGAIPSSLGVGGGSSAARSGREELLQQIKERTETSPAITAGDVDADWQQAYSSGDEAPGGDNPTPDQDIVDEIGEALGVEYDDEEELKGAPKIEARDKHRWELDPASKEDLDEE